MATDLSTEVREMSQHLAKEKLRLEEENKQLRLKNTNLVAKNKELREKYTQHSSTIVELKAKLEETEANMKRQKKDFDEEFEKLLTSIQQDRHAVEDRISSVQKELDASKEALEKERNEKKMSDGAHQETIRALQDARAYIQGLAAFIQANELEVPLPEAMESSHENPQVQDVLSNRSDSEDFAIAVQASLQENQTKDDSGAAAADAGEWEEEVRPKQTSCPNDVWVEDAQALLDAISSFKKKEDVEQALQFVKVYMGHIPATHPMLPDIQRRYTLYA